MLYSLSEERHVTAGDGHLFRTSSENFDSCFSYRQYITICLYLSFADYTFLERLLYVCTRKRGERGIIDRARAPGITSLMGLRRLTSLDRNSSCSLESENEFVRELVSKRHCLLSPKTDRKNGFFFCVVEIFLCILACALKYTIHPFIRNN